MKLRCHKPGLEESVRTLFSFDAQVGLPTGETDLLGIVGRQILPSSLGTAKVDLVACCDFSVF